jgi:ABC-type antimicrobial peptide transport system permease subunit
MTRPPLLARNLLYHWRGNLAVLLGVAVGAAVLTGALLVGDALRGSLRDLALQRLGWVDQAMIATRFVRSDLAKDLPASRVAPAILLRATAANRDGKAVRGVTLMGVDARFGLPEREKGFRDGGSSSVALSPNLARDLGVGVGDEVSFRVQKPGEVPRESLLGQRDDEDAVSVLRLRVAEVLSPDELGARFSLQPSPEAPRNAFVPLAALQRSIGQIGRVNALLAEGTERDFGETFGRKLDLDDWGLLLLSPARRAQAVLDLYGRRSGVEARPPIAETILQAIDHHGNKPPNRAALEAYFRDRHPYLSLQSREAILDDATVQAALEAAEESGLRAAATLVYLAKLSAKGKTIAGVVAALDPGAKPPLGVFLPPDVAELAPGQIVLADWADQPVARSASWNRQPRLPELTEGDEITLTYKPPEHRQDHPLDLTARFRYAGIIPLAGVADDPGLTPEFPGVTDKPDPSEWKLPFDDRNWNNQRIREQWGDPFWYEYRTTPKAYIRLDDGRKLWSSRFGSTTSVRLAPKDGGDLDAAAERIHAALLKKLRSGSRAPAFEPVKARALDASVGGTDFGPLFLGFSFFLIAAALLLTALLFRLNLDRRASEVGLLLAVGFRQGAVRRLLLAEGVVLALLGTALGCAAALGYAAVLLQFLAAIWPGGALKSFLKPHFENSTWSLLIGAGASLLVSALTIAWAVRGLGRTPPRALLAGDASIEQPPTPGRRTWAWWIAIVGLLGGLGLMACAPYVQGHEEKASCFFGSGALFLTAGLAGLSGWMRSGRHRTVEGGRLFAVVRLGVRNAARHPGRSLLTAGLLASAAFLIVAVEAFRRRAGADTASEHSGSGGFNLLAESDRPPPFRDLVAPKARSALLDRLERRWREQIKEGDLEKIIKERRARASELCDQLRIIPIRVKSGDDASCLNLYQPTRPRIFGVPNELIDRGGFQFAEVVDPKESSPWRLLLRELKASDAGQPPPLPAFGENNTVVWMLKKGLRGVVQIPSEGGTAERALEIDGLLQDSIFQSGLLVSEENFLKLYPSNDGPTFFLIRAPVEREQDAKDLLEAAYAQEGLEVSRTADRLEQYLAVENTYLTTFQALGGLGLLLGSLGLAVVLLRGVWERRGELALLRALGWRRGTLARLVLAENGFLLLVGLAAGTLSAALAVAPHLVGGGEIPWLRLLGMLTLVLIVGLFSAALAAASTLRAPLLPALRRE